jgi:putative flippase GtrA
MKEQLNALFAQKTNKVFIQLFRYTFVGGFAFLVDFGLLFFLKEVCGLHYLLSATLSFIAGCLSIMLAQYHRTFILLFFCTFVKNFFSTFEC